MGKNEQFIRIAIILFFLAAIAWNTYKKDDAILSKEWANSNLWLLIGLTIGVGIFMWKIK